MLDRSPVRSKVDLRFVACEENECDEPKSAHPYSGVAIEFPDESLDFALVDGMIRISCMEVVLDQIKPGGLLILDNANRYVPNPFGKGHTTIHEARKAPRSPRWQAILSRLESWRAIHTTDGIWDTRFWIKSANHHFANRI